MKHEWKAPVRFGIVLFALYLAIHYWGKLSALLLLGLGAAFPLVLGAVVAYAVNILMSMYERWYFPASRSRAVIKSRRPVCLVLAYASLIAIVVLIVRMILPELANSVSLLVREMVPLLEELSLKINENLDMNQLAAFSGLTLADGSINWREILTTAINWLISGLGGVMGSVISLARRLMDDPALTWREGVEEFLRKRRIENLNELERKSSGDNPKKEETPAAETRKEPSSGQEYRQKKFISKEERKTRNRIAFLERNIGESEQKMKDIEKTLSSPGADDDIMELTRQYLELKRDIDAWTDEWGRLVESIEN